MKKKILILIVLLLFAGCTQNERTRVFGGTQNMTLNQGEKLINATWKDTDLWLLVELPDGSKEFREYSTYGMMNGKITIHTWGAK